MKSWHVYLIFNQKYTYIGATNNLKQRIRKHNGEIKGGAKYTTKKGKGWQYACYVSGFKNNIDALQFEWAWKHVLPRGKGVWGRYKQLEKLVNKTRWTSKAVEALDYELTVTFEKPEYLLAELDVPDYILLDVNLEENNKNISLEIK